MRSFKSLITAPLGIIRNRIFFFIFLNGFLLALLVYFFTEDNYEQQIFNALATQVKESSASKSSDSILINSLKLTYNLEKFRLSVFGNKEINALKSNIIRPVTFDLMTGSGACGSYSFVLSRLLDELGFETRFAQMKVGDSFGGHIIIEAKTDKGWVALDASYNLYFKKKNGELASFRDVQNDWAYFSKQVPADYDPSYSYSGVRYTNWEKVPVLMPMIKGGLNVVKGKEAADEFSMRSLFVKKFSFLFKVTLVIYILATMLFIRLYIRQSNEIKNFNLSLLFAKKSMHAIATSKVA